MKKVILVMCLLASSQVFAYRTYFNNGMTSETDGNRTYFSNGVTAEQQGNTIYYSNGQTATIGN